jgi:hypothetical protein
MTLNPLNTLNALNRDALPAQAEQFAGPYYPTELEWLLNCAIDAIAAGHGCYITRTKSSATTRSSATLYLVRGSHPRSAPQPLSEIIAAIDRNEAIALKAEIQVLRRVHNLRQAYDWISKTLEVGHLPGFIKTADDHTLTPYMIRRHLDLQQRRSNYSRDRRILITVPPKSQDILHYETYAADTKR